MLSTLLAFLAATPHLMLFYYPVQSHILVPPSLATQTSRLAPRDNQPRQDLRIS